jgi:hypothetical protein
MMPIEPVFEEISMKFSLLNQQLRINVPDAVEIESLKSKVAPTTLTTLEPGHTVVDPPIILRTTNFTEVTNVANVTNVTNVTDETNRLEAHVSPSSPSLTSTLTRRPTLHVEHGAGHNSPPLSYNMDLERSEPQAPRPISNQVVEVRWWDAPIFHWRGIKQISGEISIWDIIFVILIVASLIGYSWLIVLIVGRKIAVVGKVFAIVGVTLLFAVWIVWLLSGTYRRRLTRLLKAVAGSVYHSMQQLVSPQAPLRRQGLQFDDNPSVDGNYEMENIPTFDFRMLRTYIFRVMLPAFWRRRRMSETRRESRIEDIGSMEMGNWSENEPDTHNGPFGQQPYPIS